MKEKLINLKSNKAITLIALVITIIVLLILAGVTIATLTGDNGLLQKATTAKEANEESKELELIKLAVSSAQVAGQGNITTDNLNSELQNIFNNENEVDETKNFYVYKMDKSYRIYRDGKIEEGNLLPDEYQRVEYIEAQGQQYIDTGLKANVFPIRIQYSAAKSELEKPSRPEGNLFPYIAAQKYGDYTRFYSLISDKGNGKNLLFTFQPNGSNSLYNGFRDVTIDLGDNNFIKIDHEVTETYTKLLVNDEEFYTEYEKSNYTGTENITIFRLVDHSGYYSNGKLKYFKAYINNELKINLVPCYNKQDGKIGMYDTVEEKLFTNQGTGEFIAGPKV